MKLGSLLLIIPLLFIAPLAGAAPNATLRGFLSNYIPNATISSSTYYNTTIGSLGYVLVQQNSSYSRFAVVNVTSSSYSLVLSNATAYNAVAPLLVKKFYPSAAALSNLSASMDKLRANGTIVFNQCLTLTGLNYYTCTPTTPLIQCISLSCNFVTLCGGSQSSPKSAIRTFGLPSPFAYGIENFSIQYQQLNASYNSYYSLLRNINQANYGASIAGMQAAVANITSLSTLMFNNPIFNLPANLSYSSVGSKCSSYSGSSGPWWCYATGFCPAGIGTFNQTLLGGIKNQLKALQALPVSGSAVSSIAVNSTALAAAYIGKVAAVQHTAQLNAFLTSIYPQYNYTIANVSAFVGRIRNTTLLASLQSLEGSFAAFKSKGINQNLTASENTITTLLANVTSIYTQLNALYGGSFAIAYNNTHDVLVKELSFKAVPLSLATLAARQAQINAQFNQGVNTTNAKALVSNLTAIRSGLGLTFIPIYGASMVKGFDGGIINSLLSGSSAPIPAKLATGGVLDAALFSLGISVTLFVIFYVLFYTRLKAAHRIRLQQHRVRRAWRLLFIGIFIIAIIYVGVTYTYASAATSFLPFSGFIASLRGATNVTVAYNASEPASTAACASSVKVVLNGLSKGVTTIQLQNYSCASSSDSSLAGTSCLNRIIATGKPVIFLTSGPGSNITYRGLYGHVLYASGAAASGTSCLLSAALKYK